MDARGWVRVCVGMQGCAQVYAGVRSVGGCAQVCASVQWCSLVCAEVRGCLRVCVWDEFSEYLLENRVPTSADFNTYPIRIFVKALSTTMGVSLSHENCRYFLLSKSLGGKIEKNSYRIRIKVR